MRDNYYSFMKGVAIIAVLFIHTSFMSSGESGILARQLFTFAVSMFFFLSGYFTKLGENVDFKGIIRIMIPYSLWSIMWFAFTSITGSQPVTLWKIINTIFFGGAFFPLYFLIVLVELKLLSPFIIKNIKRLTNGNSYQWHKDYMLLITPITLGILYAIQYYTKQQPTIYAQIFPTWFIMYYTGCLYRFDAIKVDSQKALLTVIASIYIMNVEATFINKVLNIPFWAASQIKISSFLYSISLCILFMNLHRHVKRGIIVRLGEYSFGIFLLHIPVKMVIEKIMLYAIPIQNPCWQILVVVLTLIVCWMVIDVTNRFLPERFNRYLGLK